MSEDNLFPLLLTNFEAALLADDRPAYPMTVLYRLRFTGFLEPATFRAALEAVARRHPLIRAIISRNRWGRLVWEALPNWQPEIQRQAWLTPSGWPHMTYLDIRQESGFRWWILERGDGHDVVIQAHHCCTDGIGINMIMEDLLVSYALNQSGQDSDMALRPLDAQWLLQRGAPELSAGKSLKMALNQLRGLVGAYEFLERSPAPLMGQYSTITQSATTPPSFPAVLSYEFDLSETEKIRAVAKFSKVTINILLLRALFLSVAAWRQKRGIGDSGDWLRIAVPINLRDATDNTMPMSNSISMIVLDRRAADFEDEGRLLKKLYEQLWLIKRFQLQYTYILSLGIVRLVPRLTSLVTQADKCQTTTYLSNLMVILAQVPLPRQNGRLVCGNVVLESMDIASVLRPHTNAGFLAYSYGGRLRLTLQYDSRVVSAEQAGELLDMYRQQIRRTMMNKHNGQ